MAKMTTAQLQKRLDRVYPGPTCAQLKAALKAAQAREVAIKAALAKESAAIARLLHQREATPWRRHTVRRATAAATARTKRHDAASATFFKINNEIVNLRATLKSRGCKTSGLGASAARCPADIGSRHAPKSLRMVRR